MKEISVIVPVCNAEKLCKTDMTEVSNGKFRVYCERNMAYIQGYKI